MCFNDRAQADQYYDKLTKELMTERNRSQGVLKVIAGVEENVEVISEYDCEEICELCD